MKYTAVLFTILALLLIGCNNKETNPVSNILSKPNNAGTLLKSTGNFRAHLNGGAQVPPVNTNAQGEVIFQVSSDSSSIHYQLITSNIENVIASHIHLGAVGENGSPVVWLYPRVPPPLLIPGRFDGVLAEGTITAADLVGPLAGHDLTDLLNEIASGNTYVNIHTTQNPGGEIRGQVE
jgi:hypothetical protein